MKDDTYRYLEDDFNPNTLRKDQLRNIFATHDVHCDGSMLKSQLVDLFNEHIKPRRAELRKRFVDVSASGSNIEFSPRSGGSGTPAGASASTAASKPKEEEEIRVPRRRTGSPGPKQLPKRELSPGRASPRRTASGRRVITPDNAPELKVTDIPELKPARGRKVSKKDTKEPAEPVDVKPLPNILSPRSPARKRVNRKVDTNDVQPEITPSIPVKSEISVKASRKRRQPESDSEANSSVKSSPDQSFSNDNVFQVNSKRVKKEDKRGETPGVRRAPKIELEESVQAERVPEVPVQSQEVRDVHDDVHEDMQDDVQDEVQDVQDVPEQVQEAPQQVHVPPQSQEPQSQEPQSQEPQAQEPQAQEPQSQAPQSQEAQVEELQRRYPHIPFPPADDITFMPRPEIDIVCTDTFTRFPNFTHHRPHVQVDFSDNFIQQLNEEVFRSEQARIADEARRAEEIRIYGHALDEPRTAEEIRRAEEERIADENLRARVRPTAHAAAEFQLAPLIEDFERHLNSREGFNPSLAEMGVSREFEQLVQSVNEEAEREESNQTQDAQAQDAQAQDAQATHHAEADGDADADDSTGTGKLRSSLRFVKSTLKRCTFRLLCVSVYTLIASYIIAAFTLLGLGFMWYRDASLNADFCNINATPQHIHPPWTIYDTGVPFVSKLQDTTRDCMDYKWPKCMPCPEHAQCFPERKLVCDPGFVEKRSLLSLGGLLLTTPRCIPDWEETRKLKVVREFIVQFLRESRANTLCSSQSDATSEPCPVPASEIKQYLYSRKHPSLSDDEFTSLVNQAIDTLSSAYPEVYVVRNPKDLFDCEQALTQPQNTTGNNDAVENASWIRKQASMGFTTESRDEEIYLGTTSNEMVGFSCRTRLLFRDLVLKNLRQILLGVSAIVSLNIIGMIWHRRRVQHQRVMAQVQDIVTKLIQQSNLASQDSTGKTPAYLRAPFLLSNVPRNQREKLTKLVESTEYVRVRQLEVNGEIMKVWDWAK